MSGTVGSGHGRHGEHLSVNDDERVWDDREVRVMVERAREEGRSDGKVEGWEAALDAVGARRRLAGGGGYDGMGELRRLVGERFANAIEGVWEASLRQLRSTVPGGNGGLGVRVGREGFRPAKGLTDRRLVMRGAAGSGGGGGAGSGGSDGGGVIRDEEALRFKAQVERKIRKLTREMELWLARGSEKRTGAVGRCTKCKRWTEEKWVFCPWDGERVSEK